MKNKKGTFVLSTGREIKAKRGILGISADEGERDLFHGFSGEVEIYEDDDCYLDNMKSPDDEPLTPEERQEISSFMIELWKKWALPAAN